ncbi:uncharacterized protein [Dendropsophus ebraccatus]|uniref:uncharacterized protein n=1 Tax=Dendropsophus ebraccatus TaxID=150705 RepID=UPI003831857F
MAASGKPEGNNSHGSQVEDNARILWLKLNPDLSNDNEYAGPPAIYKMLLNYDQKSKKWQPRNGDPEKNNKVIMMIGATGSGKTTMVNALVNYIFGIQWKYNCRIQLVREDPVMVQETQQRSKIMVYQINHLPKFCIPHSLTIIDTPGLPESVGETPQRAEVQQIRALFYNSTLDHIDAICFVTQSSMTGLSPNQKYMFDSLLKIFGPNVKENIVTFLASAFNDQRPPELAAMINANVPCAKDKNGCPIHFTFNNGVLYADNSSDADLATEQQWSSGMDDINNFFNFLSRTSRKNIYLQKDELMKSNAPEITVEALVHRIEEVISMQHELEQTERTLRQHQVEIEKDEYLEFDVISPVKEKISTDKHCTNCRECRSTCHQDCLVAYDLVVYLCEVFYFNASCRVCRHGSSKHFSEKALWQNLVVNKKISYRSIKMKYRRDDQEELTYQMVIERVKAETEKLRNDGCELILRATDHIKQYTSIRSPEKFVELLVESEERTRKCGFQERIKILENAIIQIKRR